MVLCMLEDAVTLGVAELVFYLVTVFTAGFAACAFAVAMLRGGK